MSEQDMKDLIVRIAEAEAQSHGPDGDSYGFWQADYPEGEAGFGVTKEEAAFNFLEAIYQ